MDRNNQKQRKTPGEKFLSNKRNQDCQDCIVADKTWDMERWVLPGWSFVDEIVAKSGKRIDKISTRSMNKLLKHSWPGNIRELRNVIEYSIILSRGPVLEIIMPDAEQGDVADRDNLDNEQRRHIEKVLNQTGWRIRGVGGAAEILGMKESTLRFRMKKLGIERKSK